MRSGDYLCALSAALSNRVNDQKRKDILRYYERYFDAVGPAGVGAVAEELGDPFVLAACLAAEGGFDAGTGPKMPPTALRRATKAAGAIVLGLLAACFFIVLLLWAFRENSPAPAAAGAVDEGFHSVRVEIAVGDVELRTGDGFDVTLDWDEERSYSMSAAVEGGVLQVTSDTAPGPALSAGTFAAKVVVTVPSGTVLEEIGLKTGRGGAGVEGIQAVELALTASRGAVTVRGCQIGRSIEAESDVGDVELHGELACETRLKTGMGDVKVRTHAAEDDCAYMLECGLGTLTVNGEDRENKLEKRDGAVALSCASGMGDVAISFGEN